MPMIKLHVFETHAAVEASAADAHIKATDGTVGEVYSEIGR